MSFKIAIASDHAGFKLKELIKQKFDNHVFIDLGTNDDSSVDYPIYASKLAEAIEKEEAKYGIAICGSGIGISIGLNRNKKVRAALCCNDESAKLSRMHNNANVIAIGARFTNDDKACSYIKTFIETEFEGGRHARRVEQLG